MAPVGPRPPPVNVNGRIVANDCVVDNVNAIGSGEATPGSDPRSAWQEHSGSATPRPDGDSRGNTRTAWHDASSLRTPTGGNENELLDVDRDEALRAIANLREERAAAVKGRAGMSLGIADAGPMGDSGADNLYESLAVAMQMAPSAGSHNQPVMTVEGGWAFEAANARDGDRALRGTYLAPFLRLLAIIPHRLVRSSRTFVRLPARGLFIAQAAFTMALLFGFSVFSVVQFFRKGISDDDANIANATVFCALATSTAGFLYARAILGRATVHFDRIASVGKNGPRVLTTAIRVHRAKAARRWLIFWICVSCGVVFAYAVSLGATDSYVVSFIGAAPINGTVSKGNLTVLHPSYEDYYVHFVPAALTSNGIVNVGIIAAALAVACLHIVVGLELLLVVFYAAIAMSEQVSRTIRELVVQATLERDSGTVKMYLVRIENACFYAHHHAIVQSKLLKRLRVASAIVIVFLLATAITCVTGLSTSSGLRWQWCLLYTVTLLGVAQFPVLIARSEHKLAESYLQLKTVIEYALDVHATARANRANAVVANVGITEAEEVDTGEHSGALADVAAAKEEALEVHPSNFETLDVEFSRAMVEEFMSSHRGAVIEADAVQAALAELAAEQGEGADQGVSVASVASPADETEEGDAGPSSRGAADGDVVSVTCESVPEAGSGVVDNSAEEPSENAAAQSENVDGFDSRVFKRSRNLPGSLHNSGLYDSGSQQLSGLHATSQANMAPGIRSKRRDTVTARRSVLAFVRATRNNEEDHRVWGRQGFRTIMNTGTNEYKPPTLRETFVEIATTYGKAIQAGIIVIIYAQVFAAFPLVFCPDGSLRCREAWAGFVWRLLFVIAIHLVVLLMGYVCFPLILSTLAKRALVPLAVNVTYIGILYATSQWSDYLFPFIFLPSIAQLYDSLVFAARNPVLTNFEESTWSARLFCVRALVVVILLVVYVRICVRSIVTDSFGVVLVFRIVVHTLVSVILSLTLRRAVSVMVSIPAPRGIVLWYWISISLSMIGRLVMFRSRSVGQAFAMNILTGVVEIAIRRSYFERNKVTAAVMRVYANLRERVGLGRPYATTKKRDLGIYAGHIAVETMVEVQSAVAALVLVRKFREKSDCYNFNYTPDPTGGDAVAIANVVLMLVMGFAVDYGCMIWEQKKRIDVTALLRAIPSVPFLLYTAACAVIVVHVTDWGFVQHCRVR